MSYSKAPTEHHCFHCFDALLTELGHARVTRRDVPFVNECYPLFVTWKIVADHRTGQMFDEPMLRGCIGNFSELDLHSGLAEYAIIAAFKDGRFSPITKEELQHLQCTVSLLTDFETANHHLDWEVGTHGIRIEFYDVVQRGNSSHGSGRRYSGTFLPDVALEQGWDKIETLQYLIRKAGYHGKLDDILETLRVTRYQSRKRTVTYTEYSAYRNL